MYLPSRNDDQCRRWSRKNHGTALGHCAAGDGRAVSASNEITSFDLTTAISSTAASHRRQPTLYPVYFLVIDAVALAINGTRDVLCRQARLWAWNTKTAVTAIEWRRPDRIIRQEGQLSLTNCATLFCKVVEVLQDFSSENVDKKFTTDYNVA